MLPFRDQKLKKGRSEEIELEDDDLLVIDADGALDADDASHSVDAPAVPARFVPARSSSIANATAAFAAPSSPSSSSGGSGARRKHTLPPGSRRVLEERVEEDVAGQCLASLAQSRAHSSSHVRASSAPLRRPSLGRPSSAPPPLPGSHDGAPISVSRLPSVSTPPHERASRASASPVPLLASGHAEAPGVLQSSPSAPPPAFVRRSSASFQAAAPSFDERNERFDSARPSSVNSLAPVSASVLAHGPVAHLASPATPPEHTLIVVRERPRAAWIFAAAALGALGAIAATRFLSGDATGASDERSQTTVTTLTAASPAASARADLPPVAVVAPPAAASAPASASVPPAAPSAAPPSARPGPAVMSFTEDQGVAIKASTPRAPAGPAAAAPRAPRPAAPNRQGLGPALPDGSLSLGSTAPSLPSSPSRVSSPAAAAPSAAASAAAIPAPAASPPPFAEAPPPPRKPRVLTPEQQLAEAQLKASMK